VRYCENEFDDKQETTLNATYLEKKVELKNGEEYKIAIWVIHFNR